MSIAGLVPGRACDGCMVCCIAPPIDDPELQKKAGVRCRHCERGCRIYDARPKACRDFYCAWRMIPSLGEDWRPDRSGVLSWFEKTEVAGESVRALTLMLVRNAQEILANRGFLNFVRENILIEQTTFLARPGWDNYRPMRALINSPQMSAAAHEGVEGVSKILNQAWAFLQRQEPPRLEFQHRRDGAA